MLLAYASICVRVNKRRREQVRQRKTWKVRSSRTYQLGSDKADVAVNRSQPYVGTVEGKRKCMLDQRVLICEWKLNSKDMCAIKSSSEKEQQWVIRFPLTWTCSSPQSQSLLVSCIFFWILLKEQISYGEPVELKRAKTLMMKLLVYSYCIFLSWFYFVMFWGQYKGLNAGPSYWAISSALFKIFYFETRISLSH